MNIFTRLIAVLTVVAGLILGGAVVASAHEPGDKIPPGAASSSVNDTVRRWEIPRTVCVESRMGSAWSSDNAATKLANDTIWYWNLIHREGAGSCDGYDQIIRIKKVNYPQYGRAWAGVVTEYKYDDDGERYGSITVATISINMSYPKHRTWSQNRRTFVHELGHAMGLRHTDQCDSIMSKSWSCYTQHTTYTDSRDQPLIRDWYDSWVPRLQPMSYERPSFTAKSGGTS